MAVHPPLATVLAASVALLLAPAQAGIICCAPRQFSVSGTARHFQFGTNIHASSPIVRHYDADAQSASEMLLTSSGSVRFVATGGKSYGEAGGQCLVRNYTFVEECLHDNFQEVSSGDGDGSGSGDGDASQLKTYMAINNVVFLGVKLKRITKLLVTADCMLKEKTILIKQRHGPRPVVLFGWSYDFDAVGSLNGDPASLFAHCTPPAP